MFEPYCKQRKVTIFGSARTPRDAPAYTQAEALGQAMVDNGWFVVAGRVRRRVSWRGHYWRDWDAFVRANLFAEGQFALWDAPPGEPDDPEFASFARLAFRFNRRNHGRLRKLIDWINAEVR